MGLNAITREYAELLDSDELAIHGLIYCSAALRLDDNMAKEALSLVTDDAELCTCLLRRIKSLDCVWKTWDGSWYITEEVRINLVEQLQEQYPQAVQHQLRDLIAKYAENKTLGYSPDGQITEYRKRITLFESAYQRTMIEDQADQGALQFINIWENSTYQAKQATARCVEYLAPEIERTISNIPVRLLFLRGMAARARGDKTAQYRYFRAVWEQGQIGHVFALAAHFYGLLERDRRIAEKALRDSIDWGVTSEHQSQVYHSLGNLLARDRNRGREAEAAYRQSLLLDPSAEHQGQVQVYHSLGNLLAWDRNRWREAEAAYQRSIELRIDPEDIAQVYHSLGNLLARDRNRWREAEGAYEQSIQLKTSLEEKGQVYASWADMLSHSTATADLESSTKYAKLALNYDSSNPKTCGVCYRVLAIVYEKLGKFQKAIDALNSLLRTDAQLGRRKFESRIRERIADLEAQLVSDSDKGVNSRPL